MQGRMQSLESASQVLLRQESRRLDLRFGTVDKFYDGWAYHNATHGLDVAEAAVAGAKFQVGQGKLPPEAVPLARIAGIYHDHLQTEGAETALSPQREELSVDAAFDAMSEYNRTVGQDVFTDDDRALVAEMILATKVTGFHDGQIQQNTSVDRHVGAMMADADLSSLGYEGVRRALMLHVEMEGRAGKIYVPPVSDGRTDVEPDRSRAADYMKNQVALHTGQRFLLPVSHQMWPHQESNARLLGQLESAYRGGEIGWREVIDRSGPRTAASSAGDRLLYSDSTRFFAGLAPAGGPPAAGPVERPALTAGSGAHRRQGGIQRS